MVRHLRCADDRGLDPDYWQQDSVKSLVREATAIEDGTTGGVRDAYLEETSADILRKDANDLSGQGIATVRAHCGDCLLDRRR